MAEKNRESKSLFKQYEEAEKNEDKNNKIESLFEQYVMCNNEIYDLSLKRDDLITQKHELIEKFNLSFKSFQSSYDLARWKYPNVQEPLVLLKTKTIKGVEFKNEAITGYPGDRGKINFTILEKEATIKLNNFYYPNDPVSDNSELKKKYSPWQTMYFLCQLADNLQYKITLSNVAPLRASGSYYYSIYGFKKQDVDSYTEIREPCPERYLKWIKQNCGPSVTYENCRENITTSFNDKDQNEIFKSSCYLGSIDSVYVASNREAIEELTQKFNHKD